MTRTAPSVLASLLLGMVACGGAAPGPETPEEPQGVDEQDAALAGPVAYETRVLERTSEGCDEATDEVLDAESAEGEMPEPCAEVRLTWPQITDAPTPEAAERLRGWILDTLLVAPMGEESEVESPEAFAEEFLAGFEEYREAFPEGPGGWADERSIEVTYQDPKVVSLRFSEVVYTGGAHPNSAVMLASFDPRSGRPLRLDDLLVEGHEERLREIGERRFREARGLAPEVSLEDAGFWFENGFVLNDNWAVAGSGVVFHWDPYEIAPYVVGATEIVLTLQDLEEIVDPEGPLAR